MDASSRVSIATSASSSDRAIMALACWWAICNCNAIMQSKATGYERYGGMAELILANNGF